MIFENASSSSSSWSGAVDNFALVGDRRTTGTPNRGRVEARQSVESERRSGGRVRRGLLKLAGIAGDAAPWLAGQGGGGDAQRWRQTPAGSQQLGGRCRLGSDPPVTENPSQQCPGLGRGQRVEREPSGALLDRPTSWSRL